VLCDNDGIDIVGVDAGGEVSEKGLENKRLGLRKSLYEVVRAGITLARPGLSGTGDFGGGRGDRDCIGEETYCGGNCVGGVARTGVE